MRSGKGRGARRGKGGVKRRAREDKEEVVVGVLVPFTSSIVRNGYFRWKILAAL